MAMYPRDRTSSAGRVDQYPFTVFHRAFKANSTSAAGVAMAVPTATRPVVNATNGVHELQAGTKLIVIPYGGDTDGDEFRLSVQLWRPIYDRVSTVKESEEVAWIGTLAAIVDCTMDEDSVVAVGGAGPLNTTDFFCDKVVLPTGTTQPGVSVKDIDFSNGDRPLKIVDSFTVETDGAKYVQFHVDVNGGPGTAAADANALFAVI
jgi:hypothetical protein